MVVGEEILGCPMLGKIISSWKSKRPFVSILFLGFSSGFPYFLMISSFYAWMSEEGVPYDVLGILSWASIPYALKLFISPWIERYPLPYVSFFLGQKRGWALVAQIFLMAGIVSLGWLKISLFWMFFASLGIFFLAAVQDVAIEAYRVEHTKQNQEGSYAFANSLGFRIGMWTSGSLSLVVAHFFSWRTTFQWMSLFMILGIIGTLMGEDKTSYNKESWKNYFKDGVIVFFHFPWVLGTIFLFKLGDIFIRAFWVPFLVNIGYSKIQIAEIDKGLGLLAMIFGSALGGFFIQKIKARKTLLLWAMGQVMGCFLCYWFSQRPSYGFLMVCVLVNSVVSGFGGTAMIAYMTSFCKKPRTAIQYAFLSSFGSFSRVCVTHLAGVIAGQCPWPLFFLTASFLSMGILLVFMVFGKKDRNPKELYRP